MSARLNDSKLWRLIVSSRISGAMYLQGKQWLRPNEIQRRLALQTTLNDLWVGLLLIWVLSEYGAITKKQFSAHHSERKESRTLHITYNTFTHLSDTWLTPGWQYNYQKSEKEEKKICFRFCDFCPMLCPHRLRELAHSMLWTYYQIWPNIENMLTLEQCRGRPLCKLEVEHMKINWTFTSL